MKLNVPTISKSFESLGVPLEERASVTAVSLARAIAYMLQIPPTVYEDIDSHFDNFHLADVERTLALMNETVVFDIDAAASLVKEIWLFRYRLAHDPNTEAMRALVDSLCKTAPNLPPQAQEYIATANQNGALDQIASVVQGGITAVEGE